MGAADSESIRKVLNLPRSLRSGPVQWGSKFIYITVSQIAQNQ
jgi:hypothetical protein